MDISSKLVADIASVTGSKETPAPSAYYGTAKVVEGRTYVRIDGSDQLTPVESTVSIADGDRVRVTIANHRATADGNVSNPSAGTTEVRELGTKITEAEILIADKVDAVELAAERARIDDLTAKNATVSGRLDAAEADISDLTAGNATITGRLDAAEAEIDQLDATKLSADAADLKYATVDDLEVTNADIHNLDADYAAFKVASADRLDAAEATIGSLGTTYAKIDFANIGEAAVERLFGSSGIIGDMVMSDGRVTGTLVGVTIKGDLIEGGTVVADKLVIKGDDGLFYKLNAEGADGVRAEQTDRNSLSGSVITARSITAEKVAVDDLVAFGATIGGFHIGEGDVHSGAKAGVSSPLPGVYLGSDGQMAVGDGERYLRFYQGPDGEWRLEVSASAISFGASSKTLDEAVSDAVEDKVGSLDLRDGEDAVLLQITSSAGTAFKNSAAATVLSVTVIRGGEAVTDSAALRAAFGEGASLSWSERRMGGEWEAVGPADPRLSDGGFMLSVNAGDVGSQAVFSCELSY